MLSNFELISKRKWEKKVQKFSLQALIQCLVCGGVIKKEKIGYDCLNPISPKLKTHIKLNYINNK